MNSFYIDDKPEKIVPDIAKIDGKKALKVERPKGVAEKFSFCYKENSKKSAIYCVENPFEVFNS